MQAMMYATVRARIRVHVLHLHVFRLRFRTIFGMNCAILIVKLNVFVGLFGFAATPGSLATHRKSLFEVYVSIKIMISTAVREPA